MGRLNRGTVKTRKIRLLRNPKLGFALALVCAASMRSEPEAYQGQRVGTDDSAGAHGALIRRTILDGHKALQRRGCAIGVGGNANVVAFHPDLPCEIAVNRIRPTLDVIVPGVGGVAEIFCRNFFAEEIGNICSGKQCCDFNREREGRISAVFFPSILLRDRAVAHDETGGVAHQRPPAAKVAEQIARFAA